MTDDGRLDLDELGRVIGDADALVPDEVIGDEPRPTLGERLETAGITPFVRRHRVPVAAVVAAALLIGGTAWVRRDTRPPDDGRLHAQVVDSSDSNGNYGVITSYGDSGALAGTYTLVRERGSDDVTLLGMTGPGISTSSATPAQVGGGDPARRTYVVATVPGCLDPASLTADMSRYRLQVRRTDEFGRVVEGSVPLPLASQARWDQSLSSACLRRAAAGRIAVEWVGVTADPAVPAVRIGARVVNRTGADLMLWSRGWAGMSTRQDDVVTGLPVGAPQDLGFVERIASCDSPTLPDVPNDPSAPYQVYESDRGIAAMLTVAGGAADAAGTDWAFTWDDGMRARVQAALRQACAGAPAYSATFLRAGTAPADVQAQARAVANGDPQAVAVRTWIDVATTVGSVVVRDVQSEADITNGSLRQFRTASVRTRDGHARLAVDWMTTCGSLPSPPTYQLLLREGARTWPQLGTLDYRDVAFALRTLCPSLDPLSLQNAGWSHVSPGT